MKRTQILTGLIALALIASAAPTVCAAPAIDGIITASDGYLASIDINFYLDDGNTVEQVASGGKIYMYQDAGTKDTYVAFVVSTEVNDNLYGTVQEYGKNGRPKADWYPSWYPSWGSTGHGYEDLEESDMANFQFIDVDAQGNRTPVANFNLDYFSTIDDSGNPILHPDDTENPLPAFIAPQDFRTSWHWNMQESNVADGDNNLEESPTLATDFVDTTDEYGVYAHPDNGWIYNMIFEFKVDGDLFSGEQDFNVVIGTSHNSPVKIDGGGTIIIVPDGELPPPPGDGSPPVSYEDNVPEPATMSLLVLGGIAILTRRKR